jgi:hypothetical protein
MSVLLFALLPFCFEFLFSSPVFQHLAGVPVWVACF